VCLYSWIHSDYFLQRYDYLLCKIVIAWIQNRGTALAIMQEMEMVAGHRGHDDRNMEPFLPHRDRRSESRRMEVPVDVAIRHRAGSLEPFERREGLQRAGSLPTEDRKRERSRSVTPLRISRASSVESNVSDIAEEEDHRDDDYLPPLRRNSPQLGSPIANRTRNR
jgi:hypothetical protein